MRNLNLSNLKVGLRDLLEKRRGDLLKSKAGSYYEPKLVSILAEIDALPPALTGGTPLSVELQAKDAEHDGYGGALHFATEVYLRLPNGDPKVVEAATRIRMAFIPELRELGAPYATEADRANERTPLLESMKADLELFPMADGTTLHGVATKFVNAGIQLDKLLSSRADVPKASRKLASALRPKAIGVLFKLREDLVEEIQNDAALDRDLEHKVFGYLDTLAAMQGSGSAPAPAPPQTSPEK
jgi:hypothetical protein